MAVLVGTLRSSRSMVFTWRGGLQGVWTYSRSPSAGSREGVWAVCPPPIYFIAWGKSCLDNVCVCVCVFEIYRFVPVISSSLCSMKTFDSLFTPDPMVLRAV